VGDKKNANFWSQNLKGRDKFEDLGLGGRKLLMKY
jgi:hypothetical protein